MEVELLTLDELLHIPEQILALSGDVTPKSPISTLYNAIFMVNIDSLDYL